MKSLPLGGLYTQVSWPGPFVIDHAFAETSMLDGLYKWFNTAENTGNFGGFLDENFQIKHQNILQWTGGESTSDSQLRYSEQAR